MIGNGGHAKSVYNSIIATNLWDVVGFISEKVDPNFEYGKHKIIGTDDDLQKLYDSGINNAFICIGFLGKSSVREKIYDKLKKIGYELSVIIDPSAVIAPDVKIGEGTYIGKLSIVNSASEIGKMAIINTGAIVEHDNHIGDFTHVAVGAILCGEVKIGKNCLVGAGATIIQGVKVGDKSIIGAGSTILSDVPSDKTVYGVYK